jgi:hypothetical protein
MARLSKNQCSSLVFHYFLFEGWLPPGTTPKTWRAVTMGAMDFDDPPLPGDPDLQKKRIAFDLQNQFFLLGSGLRSPFEFLTDDEATMGELAVWCFENQETP